MNYSLIAIIISVFGSLINLLGMAFFAWLIQKSRADFAIFKNDLIVLIDAKLSAYILTERFNFYVEAHAKEHKIIDDFMVRHRDWKHEIEPNMRGFAMQLADTIKFREETKEKFSSVDEKCKKYDELNDRIERLEQNR